MRPSPQQKKPPRRKQDLLVFEKKAFSHGFTRVAGIDEAGRGPLAGPVVAVACLIEKGVRFPGINDSKLLSKEKRATFFKRLTTHPKVTFGVGFVDSETIDKINIYEATKLAMKNALDQLSTPPELLLIDAVRLNYGEIPMMSIIEGDRRSQSIAAASIIAKETRDQKMEEYHLEYPSYGFNEHYGYGTKKHLQAIREFGPCPLHRLSFRPFKT